MNETIGAKGGKNDRKRLFRSYKKKLKDQEILELEKEVKKSQRANFIKVVPVALLGEMVKTFYETAYGTSSDKEEDNSKLSVGDYDLDHSSVKRDNNKKKIVIQTSKGVKIPIVISMDYPKEVGVKETSSEKKQVKNSSSIEMKKQNVEKKEEFGRKEDLEKKEISNEKEPTTKIVQNEIPISQVTIPSFFQERFTNEVGKELSSSEESLKKLKAKKILDEYEKQLKNIRYELRELVFEYSVIKGETSSLKDSNQASILLDKLTIVIDKIEELKRRLQVDPIHQYDDDYIYTLIEDYLKDFHDKKIVSELKDSPLYILICEKIDEIDSRKQSLQKEVEDKRNDFLEKEEDFEKLKDKYYDLDKVNKQLLLFQNEQDLLLKEIKEKVQKSISVTEKVEVEMDAMTRQSRRLLQLLSLQMFLRGPKSVRNFTAITAAYLYFSSQIIKPKTTTKKYRVITVRDYSSDISGSIKEIDTASNLLYRTDKQIDKIIKEIEYDYSSYRDAIKEYDELLSNLKKIKSEINEKEYEMDRMRQEQEKLLVVNNEKVKTRGEYQV